VNGSFDKGVIRLYMGLGVSSEEEQYCKTRKYNNSKYSEALFLFGGSVFWWPLTVFCC